LLCDEATSALDSENEKHVQEALNRILGRRTDGSDASELALTSIVVAHRLATIQDADQIAVFENGRLCELGSHDELADQNGLYAAMVTAQSAHQQ